MNRICNAVASIVMFSVLMMGCGGGGGGDNPPLIAQTGSLSGAVSGTTVVAVNENGDIVASDDTAGKASDVNGNFPFTLTGIPVGDQITVYLLTGGGVYPMYFDSDGNGVPDTNVFFLSSATDIDLGFVDTDVVGQDGRAIPQNDPTDTPDVTGGTENTSIPSSLIEPDTTGLSV